MTAFRAGERHGVRTRCPKALAQAATLASQRESGTLIAHSGDGKGKSSAAFGLAARALGHGMRVGVVQFIRGNAESGEAIFFRRQPGVTWHVMGERLTGKAQGDVADADMALSAWEQAAALLSDPDVGVVILDELNVVLQYGHLDASAVLRDISARPPMQHVIVTGRGVRQELVDAADTVTDMRLVKHAFSAGIRAMPGVEY